MADVMDVFGFGGLPPGRGSSIGGFPTFSDIPFINIPPPGDPTLGGTIAGILTDIVQRFPIPRPKLPLPRVPAPKGPGRFPIPIPIPIPGGIFGGGEAGCPGCCKGFHVAKTQDPNAPSFGQCVRNRRMNPLNPRALRRATRRLKGFERAVKSTRKQLRTLAKI